jgi:hypothetical protein
MDTRQRGQQENRQVDAVLAQRLGKLRAVHTGHVVIGDYQIPRRRILADHRDRISRNEAGVTGGRFIVGAALRREETGASDQVLIGGIAPGPDVDIETQMSSLTDFTKRPLRAGSQSAPRRDPPFPVALRPTASIEVQVPAGGGRSAHAARGGGCVSARRCRGRSRARTDFDGYVLFVGLPFGTFSAEAAGQTGAALTVSREAPDEQGKVLISAANGA